MPGVRAVAARIWPASNDERHARRARTACAYKKSGPHRGPLDNSWWRRRESNPRPLPCDGSALPAELRPQARLRVGYCTVLAPSVKRESRKNERLCYEDRAEPRHATWILSIGARIIRGIGATRDATIDRRRKNNVAPRRCDNEPTSQKVGALTGCSAFLNNGGCPY